MTIRTCAVTWVLAAAAAAAASAQTSSRVAATTESLRSAPLFYHGKPIAVLGSIVEQRGLVRLAPFTAGSEKPDTIVGGPGTYVFWRERPTRTNGEIRGEFWDLGRLTEGDPRFTSYDFRPLLEATQGRWPGRDEFFVVIAATIVEAVLPDSPSLRDIVLAPEKYENRNVSISGRFRGRNLHADVPSPVPAATKYDFVIQSADASIWVSGLRPRGSGFELDPNARRDSGQWVQVGGMVRRQGSRVWIEGREIAETEAPEETVQVEVPVTPREPPPRVVFSAPVPEEVEVDPGTVVRIQFSRDMDVRSFKGRVRVTYAAPAAPAAPRPVPDPPTWSFAYNVGNRGLELKFAKPLEPFQTVRVELLGGITAIGGQPLEPWTLTFSTGR